MTRVQGTTAAPGDVSLSIRTDSSDDLEMDELDGTSNQLFYNHYNTADDDCADDNVMLPLLLLLVMAMVMLIWFFCFELSSKEMFE